MFVHYSSIENHYNEKVMGKVREKVPKDTLWIMTEKADGANFSVIGTQDGQILFGKRNSFITVGDKGFFDFTMIENSLKEKMTSLMNRYPEVGTIIVFGELIGCHHGFDHPPEAIKSGKIGLIPYTYKRGFLAFDVMFDNVFQPWSIVETSGFDTVPVIMEGTLDECLAFDIEKFRTRIPALYQELDSNYVPPFAEGVVIKTKAEGLRSILKIKHSSFADRRTPVASLITKIPSLETKEEKVETMASSEAKLETNGTKVDTMASSEAKLETMADIFVKDGFTLPVEFNIKFLLPYVNEARLHSVLSKEPHLKGKALVNVFIKDVFSTYKRDGNELSKSQQKKVYQELSNEIKKFINSIQNSQ